MGNKKILISGVILFVLLLIILLICDEQPISYTNSIYSISCDDSQLEFGEIPGNFVRRYPNDKGIGVNGQYYTIDDDVDVSSKIICAAGFLPQNPQTFFATLKHNPDYEKIRLEPSNYSVVMTQVR